MKSIKITEEQFHDLSKHKTVEVEDGGVRQKIHKMQNDTSDMKEGEPKQLAHSLIDRAFALGMKYARMAVDIEGRAKVMKLPKRCTKMHWHFRRPALFRSSSNASRALWPNAFRMRCASPSLALALVLMSPDKYSSFRICSDWAPAENPNSCGTSPLWPMSSQMRLKLMLPP